VSSPVQRRLQGDEYPARGELASLAGQVRTPILRHPDGTKPLGKWEAPPPPINLTGTRPSTIIRRMKKRAVMFDLDGTLLDTLEDLGDAANRMLRERGFPEHEYAFYRHAVGDGARMLAKRSLPDDHQDEVSVTEAHDALRRYYDAGWDVKTRPYDGIPEMLDQLREREAVLAVLSNKPDSGVQNCVSRFLSTDLFVAIRGVVPNGPIKPDPAAALAIVEELGIPAEAWLYVGDTNTDMQTAAAAGLFAVGCTWGFRDREELLATGADAIIDQPAELLPLFG
jgi:phosphoglycolate phosphatase